MRTGPIVAGSILLLVGLAAIVAGSMMREVGEWCSRTPCGDPDAFFIGMVGSGVFMGGGLAGLAGIGLIVAGVVAETPGRQVPVAVAARTRACPSCGVDGNAEARYCAACGAAVAPTLRA